jgi:hypothetical protein
VYIDGVQEWIFKPGRILLPTTSNEVNTTIALTKLALLLQPLQTSLHPLHNQFSILQRLLLRRLLLRWDTLHARLLGVNSKPRYLNRPFDTFCGLNQIFDVLILVGAADEKGLRRRGPVTAPERGRWVRRWFSCQEEGELILDS